MPKKFIFCSHVPDNFINILAKLENSGCSTPIK